jgi:hypothetical protein
VHIGKSVASHEPNGPPTLPRRDKDRSKSAGRQQMEPAARGASGRRESQLLNLEVALCFLLDFELGVDAKGLAKSMFALQLAGKSGGRWVVKSCDSDWWHEETGKFIFQGNTFVRSNRSDEYDDDDGRDVCTSAKGPTAIRQERWEMDDIWIPTFSDASFLFFLFLIILLAFEERRT